MIDRWEQLWDMVTDEADEPPHLELNPDDPDDVTLVWKDGSRAVVIWNGNGWAFAEALDTCPCDVAARDAF